MTVISRKTIHETGSINITVSSDRPRIIRTKKINSRLKRVLSRKLTQELDISRSKCSSSIEK